MPRGVVVKAGRFNRDFREYRAVYVQNQRPGPTHGQWEPISRFGYVVLAPTPHEARELVRYVGPKLGFLSSTGVIDDEWERWVLRHYMRIVLASAMSPGRPCGRNEMLYCEFVRGWYPSEDLLNRGRVSSPGITDGQIEPQWERAQPNPVASAIASSMGL
jgi:hypothetical protein